jgi:hypothetical protein
MSFLSGDLITGSGLVSRSLRLKSLYRLMTGCNWEISFGGMFSHGELDNAAHDEFMPLDGMATALGKTAIFTICPF